LAVWEFLRSPGLALVQAQAQNPTDQICSFVQRSDCSAAQRQALPPFAFLQGSALRMWTSCDVVWV
jgi:hypothetical protein